MGRVEAQRPPTIVVDVNVEVPSSMQSREFIVQVLAFQGLDLVTDE